MVELAEPAVVGPEPGGGVAANGRLEHSQVAHRYGKFLLVGGGHHRLESQASAATAGGFNVNIVVGGVDAATNLLGAGNVGGGQPKEGGHCMEAAIRALVGQKAGAGQQPGAILAHEAKKGMFLRNIFGIEARTDALENGVAQRIVGHLENLALDVFVGYGPYDGRHQLPVAVVAEKEHHAPMLGGNRLELLPANELHLATQRFVADGHQLQGFNDVVGKLAIEAALDFAALGIGELRKGQSDVGVDNAVAIELERCHQPAGKGGHRIEQPPGKTAQRHRTVI